MRHFLDFEKPIAALEGKVEELRHMSSDGSINIADEIGKLQTRIERELKTTYEKLGPWEKVQVARHPDRPRVSTIINQLFKDFTPLAGDRNYAEDYAVIGGMARFRGQAVMVMGTEKGSTTEERIKRNFGMARCNIYKSRGAWATIEVFIAASDGKIGRCFGQIDVNRAGAVCQIPYCNGAHGMSFSSQLSHIMQAAAAVIHFGD